MKRQLLFICLFLSFFVSFGQTIQQKWEKERERRRIEVRRSGDDFYNRGDILYLLFEKEDSLQYRERDYIIWLRRNYTADEIKENIKAEADILFSDIEIWFSLLPIGKSRDKILTAKQVDKLILTRRKELMNFYEREQKRCCENSDSLKEGLILSEWDLREYFKALFILLPQANGTYLMYGGG